MNVFYRLLLPETVLAVAAGILLLMGVSRGRLARHLAPGLALAALLAVFFYLVQRPPQMQTLSDVAESVHVFHFTLYIKLITAGIGALLVMLAWPTNDAGTANPAVDYGLDGPEFFGLMLLSLCGIFLVASANDVILLFLGVELASIPTYVMVSISRPLPAAQEAGVKYFFLGAMSAALMLFGFSYLYGTTGLLDLKQIRELFRGPGGHPTLTPWQMLAVLMVVAGLAFKIAAVPLHFYAGDVYQGAATPVTAFLSFVPKVSGFVALIKVLFLAGGGMWIVPEQISRLLWILAVLTMSVGNVLGLLQFNVKRVLAYSSIAHSGYILVGLTTLLSVPYNQAVQHNALRGVLFYLAAYGMMNVGAFAVLMMLPSRQWPRQPGTSAETFEDLAGQGRRYPGLGLAMAICCFSLIGLPLTVGFWGKLYLIGPALEGGLIWLAIITVVNAAVSAAYYLRIVGALFLRPEPATAVAAAALSPAGAETEAEAGEAGTGDRLALAQVAGGSRALPLVLSMVLATGATLLFGILPSATSVLASQSGWAVSLEADAPLKIPGTGSR